MTKSTNPQFLFKLKTICFFLLPIFFLTSCFSTKSIYKKKDYLNGNTIYSYSYFARKVELFEPSSIASVFQTINKIITSDGKSTYRVFDDMNVNVHSLDLKKQIIYVIDDKPYTIPIDSMIIRNYNRLNEQRSTMLNKDSIEVSVVTGYSIEPKKMIQFIYTLPNDVVAKIEQSKHFFFYYQSEKYITNFRPTHKRFRKLKRLIRKQ